MSATCKIVVESVENAVSVPVNAVQSSDSGKYVIVVNDDETTTKTKVETGISDDDYIEIKSGISSGTKIQMQNSDKSNSNRSSFPGMNRGGMSGGDFSGDGMPSGGMRGGDMPSGSFSAGGFSGRSN